MDSLSDNEKQILKQVEFYFSDSNFPNDKYLRSEAEKSTDGLSVPIETICTFKRMKALDASPEIVQKVSKCSSHLKISEDGKFVGRATPIPDASDLKQIERTIYVKGWPQPEPTLETVAAHYAEYGTVCAVRLRRRRDKTFKGTMLVEFADVASAEKALKAQPKRDDTVLIYQTAAAWQKEKEDERSQLRHKEKTEKKETEEKETEEKESTKEVGGKREREEAFEKGKILKFSGVPETVKRTDVKIELANHGDVQYVDYDIDCSGGVGCARFASAEGCLKAKTHLDTNDVFGVHVSAQILEGAEEEEYYSKMRKEQANKKMKGSKGKRGRGGKRGRK